MKFIKSCSQVNIYLINNDLFQEMLQGMLLILFMNWVKAK